jgi:hypothetical protein
MLPGMDRMRVTGWGAAVVAVVVVLAGCSDSGGGSEGGKASPSASSSPAASSSVAVVAPRAAFEAYQAATVSGCTDAGDCQEFMTRKLAAAVQVRDVMQTKDPDAYAVPIGYVAQAEAQADHFGRDSLGAKGNMLAVSLPLQKMVAWFREHPEG